MPKALAIPSPKKFISYADIPMEAPFLGLFLDRRTSEIPPGGWSVHDGWHYYTSRLMCYPGWRGWDPGNTGTALATDTAANYIFDFVKEDQTRYLIIGDKEYLYLFNREVNPLTADGVNTLTKLNAVAFAGTFYQRWQSAVINNQLILVNIATTAPQVFVDDATALAGLAGDASMPSGAQYVINSVNHLIFANTVEGGVQNHQRIRWSDINNPTVFVPALGTNEAGYIDLNDDSGDIRGMASIGPSQFVVYTARDTYLFTYVGLPAIWNIQRKVLTDIGCLGSYSLIAKENNHYFWGLEGFYKVAATIVPTRIGEDRVDAWFFDRFQLNYPWQLYSFAHPLFPEIWFVHQDRGQTFFTAALVYNWEKDVWASRDTFPFGALGEVMLSTSRTMDQISTPGSDTLTWQQKSGSGSLVILSSGEDGTLYIHDGTDEDANGVPLLRQLRSGDLVPTDWSKFGRLSRIFYKIMDIDLTEKQVTSVLLSRTTTQQNFALVDQFVLDGDARHDIRWVDKVMQLGLDTYATPSLSGIMFRVRGAGERA